MKAVRYYAPEQPLKYEEAPLPKIGADEVLIQVKAAGICHTDLHFMEGVLKPWKGTLPLTLGHEIAGDIVSVGKNVKGFKVKDRVVLANVIACGKCEYCKSGRENLCNDLDQIGFTVDGGYAEYVKTKEQTLVKLPENVSYEVGSTLTCAAASCYHAIVDIAEAKKGETILLNGFGGLGTNALQIAKHLGLKVIAVDVAKDKLKMAQELGAEKTINAATAEHAGGNQEVHQRRRRRHSYRVRGQDQNHRERFQKLGQNRQAGFRWLHQRHIHLQSTGVGRERNSH